jgi:hypothetical protein
MVPELHSIEAFFATVDARAGCESVVKAHSANLDTAPHENCYMAQSS